MKPQELQLKLECCECGKEIFCTANEAYEYEVTRGDNTFAGYMCRQCEDNPNTNWEKYE